MRRAQARCPMSSDRLGWHKFYAAQFDYWVRVNDHHGAKAAAQLALWYLFLHISENES